MRVESIKYSAGGLTFQGELIYDESVTRPRPAVLLAPNWLGVTSDAIERGKLLAADRYVVLVVDMYGEGRRPASFDEAPSFANPLRADPIEVRRRMAAALETLLAEGKRRGLLNDHRAAIGFCFGGGNVLELARSGADIHAVVSIHGDLKTSAPANKGEVKAAVLVAHGAPDPVAPKADRDAFEAEMDAAGAKWQMLLFGGILHAYTDVGVDIPGVAKYDELATKYTYALTHAFLEDAFAGRL
jgi:dienelactone hydrolase